MPTRTDGRRGLVLLCASLGSLAACGGRSVSLDDGGVALPSPVSHWRDGSIAWVPDTWVPDAWLPDGPVGWPDADAGAPPPTEGIRASVSWDAQGDDWELHLIRPGGKLNDSSSDCTWTTCVGGSPDWGVSGDPSDDPWKDTDDIGTYGPETITLSKPAPGLYTVMVEHWGTGGPSSGAVTIDVAATRTVASITNLASHHVWLVATVDWPSGHVETSQQVIDCSASWWSGCLAPLP